MGVKDNWEMGQKKRVRICCCFLLLCFMLMLATGCQQKERTVSKHLTEGNIQHYMHPVNGLALNLPKDWVKSEETDDTAIFTSADGKISFAAEWELGGFSYYSLEELEETAVVILDNTLTDTEILRKEVYKPLEEQNAIRVVAQGKLPSYDQADKMVNGVAELVIVSPIKSVRYYFLTVCGVDEYQKNYTLFDDIYQSFTLEKPEDELYALLEERALAHQQKETADQAKVQENDAANAE